MQAKTSVSDYRKSSELRWAQLAVIGREKPKLTVIKAKQVKLKPGLY